MDRAQFLQGLRTGGPRPTLPGNQNIPRFQSGLYDDAQLLQMGDSFQQMNLFQQQQQQQLAMMQAQAQVATLMASQAGGPAGGAQAQALQMQMEVMRLQVSRRLGAQGVFLPPVRTEAMQASVSNNSIIAGPSAAAELPGPAHASKSTRRQPKPPSV